MSNFAFLQPPEWSFLFESAKKAEDLANHDARASCFYARRTLELAVAWLYRHDPALRQPYQDTLSALIHEPTFRQTVGDALFTKARLIKSLGNLLTHGIARLPQRRGCIVSAPVLSSLAPYRDALLKLWKRFQDSSGLRFVIRLCTKIKIISMIEDVLNVV